ncbi:MAG: tripartite tricarboxylate transporter substrate binding protein [Spirochaetia bacterium]|jgi:tripartite-type tricarboxylate transporter receptor subunit TctC|nr:tripartite tricarboxylate transporter substrate binding protein [Spirochaetia bacterium]
MRKFMLLGTLAIALLLMPSCSKQETQEKATATKTATQKTEIATKTENSVSEGTWTQKKDITWIVPYEAGGNSDVMARVYAKYLSKYAEHDVNIVNVNGAGGRTGAAQVMKDTPDGYTYLMQPVAYPMQYSLGVAKFTYKDFDMVGQWVNSTMVLVVNADSPYKTLADLAEAGKAQPKTIKMGSRTGTLPLFAVLDLEDREQVQFNVVDLSENKAPELLSGRIDAYIDGVGAVRQYLDSGKFRCLAVVSDTEVPGGEQYQTYKELGFKGYEYLKQSFGIWAPKGTPQGALDYMNELTKKASADKDCIAEMANLGVTPTYMTIADYTQFMSDTYASFQQIAKKIVQ